MYQQIINWLKKPYYFNDSNKFKLTISFALGLFIFVFLVIFEPAGLNEITINSYLFRLIYGAILTFVLLFFFFVITKRFPNYYNNENWTVGKHILNIVGIMTVCALLNWIYTKNILTESLYKQHASFLIVFGQSMSIGMLPVLIFIYFDEKYHSNKYKLNLDRVENTLPIVKKPILNKLITIYSTSKKDSIQFKINNLVYVTSEANYACFFIKKEGKIKEYILRLPLQSVENELADFNQILRCHKSYIINTKYVLNISGNARGYYLHFNDVNHPIPVSRKIPKKELFSLLNFN